MLIHFLIVFALYRIKINFQIEDHEKGLSDMELERNKKILQQLLDVDEMTFRVLELGCGHAVPAIYAIRRLKE